MVQQDLGSVLFNNGPVLLQIPGDLIDVVQVDPDATNNKGRSWTVAVQDLDEHSLLIKEGVVHSL